MLKLVNFVSLNMNKYNENKLYLSCFCHYKGHTCYLLDAVDASSSSSSSSSCHICLLCSFQVFYLCSREFILNTQPIHHQINCIPLKVPFPIIHYN